VQTGVPLPFSISAIWLTQAGAMQTEANLFCIASVATRCTSAAVDSGFRIVWSIFAASSAGVMVNAVVGRAGGNVNHN
jgi:hypothetical protein